MKNDYSRESTDTGSRTRLGYLLRRFAGSCVVVAILFFIFLDQYRWLYGGIVLIVGIAAWLLAIPADKRGTDKTKEWDEKGNVKKKIM